MGTEEIVGKKHNKYYKQILHFFNFVSSAFPHCWHSEQANVHKNDLFSEVNILHSLVQKCL